jgi:adenosine deaminase
MPEVPTPVDAAFTKVLPKIELHAHLTGSISPETLHQIWQDSKSNLQDPLIAVRPEGAHHDIFSFFKVFDTYIYDLCNTPTAISFATREVLKAFRDDGVKYLELRTTPREALATGLSKEIYVETVLDAIADFSRENDGMHANLILSIDRRNTTAQAEQVLDLAMKYRKRGCGIVGIDLCGNPLKGDVAIFREAFARAREEGFKVTLHFAEVPESSTELELETLLEFQPDRIGHVIHVPPKFEKEIEGMKLGLELCLSCNVHAKMLPGKDKGFADHHFGEWYKGECPIALCVSQAACISNLSPELTPF